MKQLATIFAIQFLRLNIKYTNFKKLKEIYLFLIL